MIQNGHGNRLRQTDPCEPAGATLTGTSHHAMQRRYWICWDFQFETLKLVKYYGIWRFPKFGVPQNGWFHPIEMDDDLGVPPCQETSIFRYSKTIEHCDFDQPKLGFHMI